MAGATLASIFSLLSARALVVLLVFTSPSKGKPRAGPATQITTVPRLGLSRALPVQKGNFNQRKVPRVA
jgi:hypothetical protein